MRGLRGHVGAGVSRAKRLLFAGATVVSFVSASAVAQDRSGPRSAADREMVQAERTYQEALRLRAQGERAESDRMLRAAEQKFRTVLRLDPARAEAAIRTSLILYAANRSREAVPILEAALAGSPARNDLKHQLGIHLLAVNRTAEAQALLEAVTQADPELYDAHLLLARHYYRTTREHLKAVERFSAYLRSRPGALAAGDAEVYGSIGNAYLAAERYPEARAQYQKVLRLSERNLPARINIAFSYFQEGSYREAVSRYEGLLRLGDPHPIVLANLARSLWRLRRGQAAISRARQLQRFRPRSHLGYLVEAEILLESRDHRGAVARVRDALSRAPRDVPTLIVAGKSFQAVGDVATAERHLRVARRLAPRDLDVVAALATLLRKTRRERDALPLFEQLTRERPGVADGWAGLGACHYALGDDERARSAFDVALERQRGLQLAKQGLAATHNRVGVALAERGDLAGAKAALERAITADPDDRRSRRNLGEILLREGDARAALPHLERGAGATRDRDGAFLLGRALLALGRPADAAARLEAALGATGRISDAEVGLALGVALSLEGDHDAAVTRVRAAVGDRPAPEQAPFWARVLWRRAVSRIDSGDARGAQADLTAAQRSAERLSRDEQERLAFTVGLAFLARGDGRHALAKLQPLARSTASYLAAPYDRLGIEYFLLWARYLADDYRSFFASLRSVRGRVPAEIGETLGQLEINARIRNAEALFRRGSFGPAAREVASIRELGRTDNGLVRLANGCLDYARGQRAQAGAVFAELSRRVRAGTDADVPREALLNLGIFHDEVQHDPRAAAEAYRQYLAMGGRHPDVARKLLDRKRRVLGIGAEEGAP